MKITALLLPLALLGCLRAAEERALSELEVGIGSAGDADLTVAGGLAQIRTMEPGRMTLWSQSPVLQMAFSAGPDAPTTWTLTIENAMPDAELQVSDPEVEIVAEPVPRPTVRRWRITLPRSGDYQLEAAPPDADEADTWRFAFLADIQQALPGVDEVFRHINAQPGLRFVIGAGDLVNRARIDEYDLLEEQLRVLDIPLYSTIGNHELWADPARWRLRFGRFNVHFTFKEVAFSLVDSGSASIDPVVYGWLDDWLDAARDQVHVFATHHPPVDPIGTRSGSFRSRPEAALLLQRLAAANVDLTLYGHIHSYYAYENAGIPAYIAGGGGAWPELWDDVGRHYLVIDVTSNRGIDNVGLARVD